MDIFQVYIKIKVEHTYNLQFFLYSSDLIISFMSEHVIFRDSSFCVKYI